MRFELTEEEVEKARKFMTSKRVEYCGAIGGQFTFTFSNTSIGQFRTVIDNVSKEECHLTDLDNF